ncbi:MAG: bifunctional 5,10-methylenetetrahydrofolate dehydrogenase/5,10-methenyltetrahydrofolate cyclohydrolase [Actinomycetota bacterium]|nr:bifunctional 5,10-methylenetetrahydrofolate dehydrogenase/5,10-methenyltetrahydrofolate cyclohydrolase [Actinomycetota bacterium]
MTAQIIDGKAVAAQVRQQVAEGVAALTASHAVTPGLAAIVVGDDPASHVYVGSKEKAAKAAGMNSWVHKLKADCSQQDLGELLTSLSQDSAVNGILLQMPLPKGLDSDAALDLIAADKDVDGLTPASAGRLALGRPGFVPCTPLGVKVLLEHTGVKTEGAHVVVVGRSNLVGRPLSILMSLKAHSANATVTLCHTATVGLEHFTRQADILVIAAGTPKGIGADMIKPGATVIDVGINRGDDGKLVGDVDFDSAVEVAGAITPVPGGVGPMTVAMLMQNTLLSAQMSADAS